VTAGFDLIAANINSAPTAATNDVAAMIMLLDTLGFGPVFCLLPANFLAMPFFPRQRYQ
jgi:hypothetical protein